MNRKSIGVIYAETSDIPILSEIIISGKVIMYNYYEMVEQVVGEYLEAQE